MMHSMQVVVEQGIYVPEITGDTWSDDDDCEHCPNLPFQSAAAIDDFDPSEANANIGVTVTELVEEKSLKDLQHDGGSHYLDSPEFKELVEDREFVADLSWACKLIFNNFRQSTHSGWEDLQQEVLIRFGPWLPRYRKEAKRKTVFAKIARNLLIDASRAETALRRQHHKIDLEVLESEPVQGETSREMENQILINELRRVLSPPELYLFDEHFLHGESLRQLAKKHGLSATTLSNKRAQIIKKLQLTSCWTTTLSRT